ncbi:YciI-like protein [Noviherbaspirillum sp. ST9]|uniref:YciI-like protein n=1 Tax=Noviherbaspirillum sp. ST9 TaxID=3401606 RepID=UPI003B587839
MHFLLFYDYVPDYMARREQFRNDHLKLAWESHKRGELVLGGVTADPVDSAVLFFQADSAQVVEDFAKADPYVTGGLVAKWRVRPWNTVVGETASSPVRPV